MKKYLIILISVIFVFSACKEKTITKEVQVTSGSEYLLGATAWYQQSAEMQACYIQAFNNAKNQLIKNVESSITTLPKAVIVDIDETMLDNSPFEAYLIENNKSFTSELWSKWVEMACAKALPGAVDFSTFAKENNVTVFYISNRNVAGIDATLKNLQDKGFAFAKAENILLKDKTSDKTGRREIVAKNYEIVMLIGDNLRDFDEMFADRTDNFGFNTVEANKDLFGVKYIIMPNPMYGQWEKIYRNTEGETSISQKINNMKNNLKGY